MADVQTVGIVTGVASKRMTYSVCVFCTRAHSGFHPTHKAIYCKTCARDLEPSQTAHVFKLPITVAPFPASPSSALLTILLFDEDVKDLLGTSPDQWEALLDAHPEAPVLLENLLLGAHVLFTPKPQTRKQAHPTLVPDTLVADFVLLSPPDLYGSLFDLIDHDSYDDDDLDQAMSTTTASTTSTTASTASTSTKQPRGRYKRIGLLYAPP